MKKSTNQVASEQFEEKQASSQETAQEAVVSQSTAVDVAVAGSNATESNTAESAPVAEAVQSESAAVENVEQKPQESGEQTVTEQNSGDAISATQTEEPTTSNEVDNQLIADQSLSQSQQVPDNKKKKEKKKREDKPKKEAKVGLYVKSLFKYFNIITILPFALLMYAVFFSSYIVDKGNLFEKNLIWIGIIVGFAALVMIAWFIDTLKKRRVCSLDAFLLLALMLCGSMIAQCVIFGNFKNFDKIAIMTVAATAAVLVLLTVRLILFKPSEQRKNDDAKYVAKNKLGMYFRVIFAKYGFFISMLCVIGALLILIITKSNIFEDFEYLASNTEKIVTLVFAAVAAVLMIVGIFIRIVRGRANVVDCMPYMLFMVAIGGLVYFITRQTYMILYIAIGCAVVGAIWLMLCQYTLLMSNYKKVESAVATDTTAAPQQAATTAEAQTQPSVEQQPQTVGADNAQTSAVASQQDTASVTNDAQQTSDSAANGGVTQ
ncbi:MAG: hypothetical protein OSJ74_03065 [Clostridia bacterium]|nr:hypothetical protein [Clostridia bacterium]